MNINWALEQLDEFIDITSPKHVPPPPNVISTGTWKTESPDAAILPAAQIVEQILDRVLPGWRGLDIKTKRTRWEIHREASIRARASLQREDELKTNLGENAPDLSAAALHPWIWSGAKSLWQSAHYVQAVRDAATKLNAETRNKVGRRDVSETDLFKQSFSLDDAKPGKARLRRMTPEDSDTYRSVQRGAMTLAEGVFAGIRNPLSHEADQELREQEALEYLAALSILARWVDTAEVEGA